MTLYDDSKSVCEFFIALKQELGADLVVASTELAKYDKKSNDVCV